MTPQKPYWARSMLLCAAHLHGRASYAESQINARLVGRIRLPHGIEELEFDARAGDEGVLALRRFRAVFPSGTTVTMDARSPALRRSVAAGPARAFDIYAALPRLAVHGLNVSDPAGPARTTRFVAAARKDRSDVPPMRARAELRFEGEPCEDFELLRLGRAIVAGKVVRLAAVALPTALTLRGSPALRASLAALVGVLGGRRAELLRRRAEHPLHLASVVASELPAIELLSLVQRQLPLLEDVLARPSAHPRAIYEVLAALHGALGGFGAVEQAPRYDHDEQGPAFTWILERITRAADEAARDRTTILPFRRITGDVFRLPFERRDLAGKQPLLVLRSEDEAWLRDRVPNLLKLASPSAIGRLVTSAVRGVAVAVEFEPPDAVPRQAGVIAYRLNVRDPLWADIMYRLQIELQIPSAPAALEAFLYGVERPA